MWNMGPEEKNAIWQAAPVIQARATGMMDLGENSNSNSSIARRMAAKGLPKIAAIPAVAPAASNTFRSLSVTLEAWPMNDPKAPPVEIIGPSAPNGPPVPMEIAAERGFRMVTRGGILLRVVRICYMALGIPGPRLALAPYFAI